MPITKMYKVRIIYMESAYQDQGNEKTMTDRLSSSHFPTTGKECLFFQEVREGVLFSPL